jgi:hypothetical protein
MQLIFERKDGGNVLTADSIREMFVVYDAIRNITTARDGKLYTWEDGICWGQRQGGCRSNGILTFFKENVTLFEEVATNQDALLKALSVERYPDNDVVAAESHFVGSGPGGAAVRDSQGNLLEATMVDWVCP